MKTCKNCGIEVADEEIFCPKCGEMLLGCSVNNDAERRIGKNSLPPQPDVMTVGDIVLGRRYGKRIIQTLRTISVIISILAAGCILALGVLCILGRQSFNLPPERRTFVGILALPISLIVGFLVYFIFNIFITKYENLSLIGRNTEAQLSLLENQSALISALIDAMNENNRRVDVIGEMLDDVLRVQERQAHLLENIRTESTPSENAVPDSEKTAPAPVQSAYTAGEIPNYEESFTLINENLCNAAANTQTMLKRVENAVNNGLGKLYKMFYSALNHGAQAPEEDVAEFATGRKPRRPASRPAPQSASDPAGDSNTEPVSVSPSQTEKGSVPAAVSETSPAPEARRDNSSDALDKMDTSGSGEINLGADGEFENGGYSFDSAQSAGQSEASDGDSVSYLPIDSEQ